MNDTTTTTNDTNNGSNYAAPHRTFTEAVEACFTKYCNFTGRASRSEFWWFWLLSHVLYELAVISGHVAGDTDIVWWDESADALIILMIFLLPDLAVGARRLHDIGRSGWWQLLVLTGLGIFLLVYWWLQPGARQENEYYDINNPPGTVRKNLGKIILAVILLFLVWIIWDGSILDFIKGFYQGLSR